MNGFVSMWILLLAGFGLPSPPVPESGTVTLSFRPEFSGQALVLNEHLYTSANGDSLSVEVLRFYISGIQLKGKSFHFQEKSTCHLIDAEDDNTRTIVLENVPAGDCGSLVFYVGTDSITNVSGAMDGDLDPTLGMYWAWNSGYINTKIEGRSNACPTLHHAFTFHIGGYMPPHQTLRRVELPLKNVRISKDAPTDIQVHVDVAQFFNRIQLDKTNQVMIPSQQAALLADYFQSVFSL